MDLKSFGVNVGKGKYYEEIVYSTALIYNVLNSEISSYLKSFNLTPGKFNALMTVKHQGGEEGMSQVDVSKKLIVSASNMTKLFDKLEKEGLVTRTGLEGDKRVNMTKITAKGAKLLDEVWPGYLNIIKGLIAKLKVEDQKDLSVLLRKWFDYIA